MGRRLRKTQFLSLRYRKPHSGSWKRYDGLGSREVLGFVAAGDKDLFVWLANDVWLDYCGSWNHWGYHEYYFYSWCNRDIAGHVEIDIISRRWLNWKYCRIVYIIVESRTCTNGRDEFGKKTG